MKHSNLLLIGGSLLATTALSTVANAATIFLGQDAGGAGNALAVRNISAQAFPATASTTTSIGTNRLFIRFAQNTSAVFTATVNVTGAKFVTAGISTRADAAVFTAASIPSSIQATSTSACTVLAGVTQLSLTCDTSKVDGSVTSSSINGLVISGITFDNVSALSTAGTSVSLDFTMLVNAVSFDTAAATAVVTSRNSLTGTSVTVTPAKIDNASTPSAFFKLTSSSLSATIGSLNFTLGAGETYARNLSTALAVGGSLSGDAEVKVTSTIFADDAVTKTRLLGAVTPSVAAAAFSAGFVTFAIPAANLGTNYEVIVDFNGTKEIDAAGAGTTTTTIAAAAGAGVLSNVTAPPVVTGTVAALSRNGLAIDFNGVQPGTAQGARTYTSLIRVANTGTVAGVATMTLTNETTGVVLGTYTSASIPVGASLQVSSAQMEAGAGITPSASVLYRVTVGGNITGYAQHVTWNQDAGFFGDLSARRDATTGTNN